MSYKNDFIKASFRGVPFFVESHSKGSGRRLQKTEIPNRDLPVIRDMGRATNSFSLEVYVLGEDYFAQKEALSDALDAEGFGELRHPFLGALNVFVESWSMNESMTSDGGQAKFSISFIDKGEEVYLEQDLDNIFLLARRSASAVETSLSDFLDNFDLSGLPQDFVNETIATVESVGASAQSILLKKGGFDLDIEAIKSRFNNVADLIQDTKLLAESIISAVKLAPELYSDFKDKMEDLINDTPLKKRHNKNSNALNSLIRRSAIVSDSEAITEKTYKGVDGAIEERDSIVEKIDFELEDLVSSEIYLSLEDLKSTVVNLLPSPEIDIENILEFENDKSYNALSFLHEKTGDASTIDDFINDNSLSNPIFLTFKELFRVKND